MRKTSLQTYRQIESEGLLSALRFEVYSAIYRAEEPITQGECWATYFPHRQRHDVAPRFAELEARGVIASVGERVCRVTGRRCMVWATTNNLPKEPPKKAKVKCEHCAGKGFYVIGETMDFLEVLQ
jgi:hypothetical protein